MSETLQAAWIGANAAIRAACIQGVVTFAASVLGLAGGFFAYRGAIEASKVQVRLEWSKNEGRVAAYCLHIDALLKDLERRSYFAHAISLTSPKRHRERGDEVSLGMAAVTRVPELSSEHWENHALLGPQVVDAIMKLDLAMEQYILFREDAVDKGLQSGGVSKFSGVEIANNDDVIHYNLPLS